MVIFSGMGTNFRPTKKVSVFTAAIGTIGIRKRTCHEQTMLYFYAPPGKGDELWVRIPEVKDFSASDLLSIQLRQRPTRLFHRVISFRLFLDYLQALAVIANF